MQKFVTTILNTEGQPIQSASVYLYVSGSSTLASLYADDGTTAVTNPLTTNAYGLVQALIPNGRYDVKVVKGTAVLDSKEYYAFDPTDGGASGVTSVNITVPSVMTVSGSPITSSGTIALDLANENANYVFAGPTSGSPAKPTFRQLGLSDLPSIASIMPTGSIVQMKFGSKSDTFSSTSTSWTDVTGLSVSITPSSTSNKIILGYVVTGSGSNVGSMRLMRSGSPIGVGDAAGSRNQATGVFPVVGSQNIGSVSGILVDSPNATTAQTYSAQVITDTGTVYVNRSASDTNSTSGSRTMSWLVAMEIKG